MRVLGCCILSLIWPTLASAGTLTVGPGKTFAKPSQAIAAAKEGDTIEIDSAGSYDGDVAMIRIKQLTIRGAGTGRAKLDAQGKSAGGKGIWVQLGDNLTVENIEFIGARCADKNGSGIRSQAPGLTVRNCRFYDCENGILGGEGEVLVEHCTFDHCGHSLGKHPSHSLYIGHDCTKLTIRFNYSTHTLEGHLLKSRAAENWVLYNRLTDEDGVGSAVADFPNGGLAVVLGNVLHKGKKAHNDRVIVYGMEGVNHKRNELYVVNNTMIFERRRGNASSFVRVEKAPADFRPVIRNNLCIGAIPLTNAAKADESGNLLYPSAAEAGCVEAAKYDYRLVAKSPALDKGVEPGKVGEFSLTPESHYLHPCRKEARPINGLPDVGAFEFAPIKPK